MAERRRRGLARERLALLAPLVLGACGEEAGPGGAPAGGGEPGGAEAPLALAFEERTAAAGIDFVHVTGGYGEKLLPETMGSGAAFLDYDGDGALDLFLVNGTRWPDAPESVARGRCALLRGRGDGTFVDVSIATGADVEVYGMGCAVADYDADGDPDVYVTTLEDDVLLRNDAGSFVDVAAEAGVGRGRWIDAEGEAHPEWTTAALWLDATGDGWLDLFVAGYCQWRPEIEIFTTLDGTEKAFTTPDRYRGLPCRLYANRGDGTFEERPLAPDGESAAVGKALGAAVWDLDDDGRLEVLVANDTRPDFLFRPVGDGRYAETAAEAGLAYDEDGRARAGMGIDVGEPDDGGPVVVIGNFAGEALSWRRWVDGTFRDEARAARLALATYDTLAFGLALADLDLDGRLDLVVANGHIEPDIARYRPGHTWAQPAQLFLGRGDGAFTDASALAGADFATPRVGRGLVAGDVDEDGDLDLLVTQNGGAPALLVNRQQERAPRHWLRVRLEGRAPNLAAIGARVRLRAGGRDQVRTVRTGSSYLGHGQTALTFGLGALDAVEELEVRWPTGERTTHGAEVAGGVDRTVRVVQPRTP